MRYIRTENGTIMSYDENTNKIDLPMILNYPNQILAQADTIEELCDRYVGISNNKQMIIKYEFDEYYDEYNDTYTKEELLAMYDVIYGAIWTNKGLIYIAKMNDKGELELL